MTRLRQHELVRVVRLLNPPEHYGGHELNQRPPVVGDTGYLIEIVTKPGLPDGYLVESSSYATGGVNIWQCFFVAEELEPVELPTPVLVPPEKWEEADLELFRDLRYSPEEFAARFGHEFAMFNFHKRRYRRPGMNEWVQQLADVFLAPGLPQRLRELREKYLTPEEIRQAEEYEREPF